jgi:thioredoxin-like negative regulator of GroEL
MKKLRKKVKKARAPVDPLEQARTLLAAGDAGEARKVLEGVLAAGEDEAARAQLAPIVMQLGDYDAAAAHYRALGRVDAEALALVLGGRLDEARAMAQTQPLSENVLRAIEVAPHTTQYRMRTVRTAFDAGRWAAALAELEELIAGLKGGPTEEMLSLRRACRERLNLPTE